MDNQIPIFIDSKGQVYTGQMKKIEVSKLKAGMAFDRPVYIDRQNILVDAFEELKASDIERLTKWNIREVETDGVEAQARVKVKEPIPEGQEKADIEKALAELKKVANARDEINALMNNGFRMLTEAYEVLASEKPYQISNIRNLAEEIVNMSNENPLSFICLYYQTHTPSLYHHLMFSAIYAACFANALKFSMPKAIELVFSILMMDVGMVLLPASIKMKEGKLNESELNQLHAHPLKGYQILTQFAKVKNSVAMVALQHQEHYDGSGYPRKIKAEEISEYARVAAIVDSFSALTEDKGYRSKKLPYEAMKELLALGVYRYDPNYMKQFLYRFSVYPVGSLVELSDKSFGMVVRSGYEKPMRPMIYVYRDSTGNSENKLRFVHLLYRPDLYILNPVLPETGRFSFEAEMEILLKKSI